MEFERLIRFETQDGRVLYGDVPNAIPTEKIEGSTVTIIDGDITNGFHSTGQKTVVHKACRFSFQTVIPCIAS
jgi:transcription initiation factor TFIIH subunit 2